jgi:hypothetical protein
MNSNDGRDAFPQSIRHKRVLDLAEENPNASVDELASMVSSVTSELVAHVLEEYGDPASGGETSMDSTDSAASTGSGDTTASTESPVEPPSGDGPAAHGDAPADGAVTTDGGSAVERSDERAGDSDGAQSEAVESGRYPTLAELSERQREVLEAVATHPEATQQAIADRLDVSRSTVSNRVNSVEGFDWSDRTSFVESVFDEPPAADLAGDGGAPSDTATAESDGTATTESPSASDGPAVAEGTAGTDIEPLLDRLEACVTDLEARVAALETSRDRTDGESAFADPELVHKIVHACLNDDNISEAEELRILKEFVT